MLWRYSISEDGTASRLSRYRDQRIASRGDSSTWSFHRETGSPSSGLIQNISSADIAPSATPVKRAPQCPPSSTWSFPCNSFLSKAQFGRSEVKYLGHLSSKNAIKMIDDRIQAIAAFPQPTAIKDLRWVVGAFNLVPKYVPRFSEIVDPLVSLTREEFAQHCVQRRFGWSSTRALFSLSTISSLRLPLCISRTCPNRF